MERPITMYSFMVLYPSLFLIRIVLPVGDDDMVEEMDAHDVACAFHPLCDAVVVATGLGIVAGMVVGKGENGGVAEHGVLDDLPHIDSGLADASA